MGMTASAGDPQDQSGPPTLSTPPLAHREAELAAISEVWAGLAQGRPSVVLIRGPRGIGKSALLDSAVALLPRPAMILRARCDEAEKDFPLSVVGQLFDSHRSRGDRANDELLAAASSGVAAGVASQDVLQGLFQTTRTLAAATPVVIAIDDLHLADSQSLRWFSYITRRLEGLPVAVLATVASDLPEPSDELDAPSMTRVLQPKPLCQTCTAETVAELLGALLDPELAAACHTVSQGNPLVLHELVRRLSAAGIVPGAPDLATVLAIGAATLSDTTLTWLHRRDPAAVDLLASLAVLGPSGDPAIAAMLAGQGEYVAAQSRESLIRSGLIEPGPPDVFSTDLLRAAVLSGIPAPDRLAMHARAAELLTKLGAPATEAAEHLMLVGTRHDAWALTILRNAARDAAELGDWDDAVRYLRRALAESDDPVVSTDLSAELGAIEQHHDLASCLRYADAVAGAIATPTGRGWALLPMANPTLVADAGSGARTLVDVASGLAATSAPPQQLMLRFGSLAIAFGHRVGVRRWLRAIRSNADAEHPDAAARALLSSLAGLTAAGGRFRRRAERLASRSFVVGAEDDISSAGAALALAWSDRLPEAEARATWMVNAARSRHHRADQALALLIRADIEYRRGRLAVSLSDAQEARRLAEATNARGLCAAAAALAAQSLLAAGEPAAAADLITGVELPADTHPIITAVVLHVQSALALYRGDPAEALRLAVEAGHRLAARGIGNPAVVPWRSDAVSAYLDLNEIDAARSMAREDLAYAERWGTAGAMGQATLALSACQTGDERIELAGAAVRMLTGTNLYLVTARALAELADAFRAAGREGEAAEPGRRSAELAAQCGVAGCTPASTGQHRDRPSSTASIGLNRPGRAARLTASESRVTDLVLEGKSNQEVADELCISRRTVDTHLNRVYRKLEIRSRAELPEALHRLG